MYIFKSDNYICEVSSWFTLFTNKNYIGEFSYLYDALFSELFTDVRHSGFFRVPIYMNCMQKSNESIGYNLIFSKVTITFVKFPHGLPVANSKQFFTNEDYIGEFTYLWDALFSELFTEVRHSGFFRVPIYMN